MPSNDAVRAWRVRNRNITYRTAVNNTVAKICAERYGGRDTPHVVNWTCVEDAAELRISAQGAQDGEQNFDRGRRGPSSSVGT